MVSATHRLKQWWDRLHGTDPYWDAFLHRPPSDPRNIITPVILAAPAGSVFPQRTEIHNPAAMSGHIKELAAFFGADATGISSAAISCLVSAVEEIDEQCGIGGQFALQKCAVVNFNVAAYIRELGYQATISTENAHRYAAEAGLGKLDADGRLSSRAYGRRIGLAGVILTDLPLSPDSASQG
jgi:hypothetical protein